jgi:hypothetical protein
MKTKKLIIPLIIGAFLIVSLGSLKFLCPFATIVSEDGKLTKINVRIEPNLKDSVHIDTISNSSVKSAVQAYIELSRTADELVRAQNKLKTLTSNMEFLKQIRNLKLP